MQANLRWSTFDIRCFGLHAWNAPSTMEIIVIGDWNKHVAGERGTREKNGWFFLNNLFWPQGQSQVSKMKEEWYCATQRDKQNEIQCFTHTKSHDLKKEGIPLMCEQDEWHWLMSGSWKLPASKHNKQTTKQGDLQECSLFNINITKLQHSVRDSAGESATAWLWMELLEIFGGETLLQELPLQVLLGDWSLHLTGATLWQSHAQYLYYS